MSKKNNNKSDKKEIWDIKIYLKSSSIVEITSYKDPGVSPSNDLKYKLLKAYRSYVKDNKKSHFEYDNSNYPSLVINFNNVDSIVTKLNKA